MCERHMNRAVWFIAVAAGLGGSSLACSKDEPAPASAASVGQTQIFRFAPPNGTEFTRADRRTQEIAIVGAPLRRIDNEELTWHIRVDRAGEEYHVKQDLVYISLARNGQTLAAGKVPEGISATLLIDKEGNLKGIKGLEQTAEILRSLVTPGKEKEQVITRDSLANVIAARYKILFGDTIGRPATPGSSWTIGTTPGSFIVSRTVTVTGHESCGGATCARLQVEFKLDPRVLADTAVSMVKSSVKEAGEDSSKVNVRGATYGMSGWMLVEPETMLSHGASLTEGGTVTMASPEKVVTVEIKGTTEISYSYVSARTSEHESPTEPVASE